MHSFGLGSLPTPSIVVLWFPLLNNGKKKKQKTQIKTKKTPKMKHQNDIRMSSLTRSDRSV